MQLRNDQSSILIGKCEFVWGVLYYGPPSKYAIRPFQPFQHIIQACTRSQKGVISDKSCLVRPIDQILTINISKRTKKEVCLLFL